MKIISGKFITDQSNDSRIIIMGGALVFLLLALLWVSYIIVRDSNYDKEYAGYASDSEGTFSGGCEERHRSGCR